MATSKQPWISFPDIWPTEARFITWVRGVLRKGWANHPVKIEYLTSRKHRITNTNPKSKKAHPTVWGYICEQCNQEVTKVEIDHAGTVQGKFTSMNDIQGYAEHLFLVDFDSLECVCIPCHQIRSLAQKLGMTFEEAAIEKEVIAICKKELPEIIDFAQCYGYTKEQLSNPEKRRNVVSTILRGIE